MDRENKIQCVYVWEEWLTKRDQEAQEVSAIETRPKLEEIAEQANVFKGGDGQGDETSSGSRLASPGWVFPSLCSLPPTVLFLLESGAIIPLNIFPRVEVLAL